MNEIKEGLEEATKKELAKRTKTHDEVERNAAKNLSERYNVEMESGFPKEWEDLDGQYEDFAKGKKWENYVWIYHGYLKLQCKRH